MEHSEISLDKRETREEASRDRCKKSWTLEEDEQLRHFVKTYGKNWRKVILFLPGKSSIQCRKRWNYTLNPEIKKSNWTATEDHILVSTQKRLGNRWSAIVKYLSGRVADDAKNRFAAIKRVENGTQKRYPKVSNSNQLNNRIILNLDVGHSLWLMDKKHAVLVDNPSTMTITDDTNLSFTTDSSHISCMASISDDTDIDDFSSINSNNNRSTVEVEANFGSYQLYYPVQHQQLAPSSCANVSSPIILNHHRQDHYNENKSTLFLSSLSPASLKNDDVDDNNNEFLNVFEDEDELDVFHDNRMLF